MTRSALALCLPALAHSGCSPGAITCYNGHSTGAQNIIAGSDQVYGADSLTQEYCAQLCADRSATLAGVDSGNGCYCGDAITAGAEVRPLAECNMVCTGSRTEMCGGDWRQGVFGVNCSGAPVPPPAELPKMVNPCRGGAASNPLAAAPFCDASLPLPARVADAVGRMTLAEKVRRVHSAALCCALLRSGALCCALGRSVALCCAVLRSAALCCCAALPCTPDAHAPPPPRAPCLFR
jgi:hypothetical protein